MRVRKFWVAVLLCGGTAVAHGADAPVSSNLNEPVLPTFALAAPPTDPSPWTGLYVGSEVFAIAGGKGARSGFGGAGAVGYERELQNNWVVGVEADAGYTPSFFKYSSNRGYNFAEGNFRVGYDMGQFMPFVTAGIGFAKPTGYALSGYTNATNSVNDLFSSAGDLRSFETVGAGFAYRLTDKLTVELAVQAYRGNGYGVP